MGICRVPAYASQDYRAESGLCTREDLHPIDDSAIHAETREEEMGALSGRGEEEGLFRVRSEFQPPFSPHRRRDVGPRVPSVAAAGSTSARSVGFD